MRLRATTDEGEDAAYAAHKDEPRLLPAVRVGDRVQVRTDAPYMDSLTYLSSAAGSYGTVIAVPDMPYPDDAYAIRVQLDYAPGGDGGTRSWVFRRSELEPFVPVKEAATR